MTIPDFIVFITSTLTLGLLMRCEFKTSVVFPSMCSVKKIIFFFIVIFLILSYLDRRERRRYIRSMSAECMKDIDVKICTQSTIDRNYSLEKYLHGYIQFALCLSAGLLYPSVLTLPYLIGSILCVLAVAFGFSIYWLELM